MNNKKLKVLQIISDLKFLNGIDAFEGDYFINEVIAFKSNDNYVINNKDILYVDYNKDCEKIVLSKCENKDLIIIWGLDYIKSYIVNKIPQNIKIAWYFFGYELYKKKPELFLSEKTIKVIKNRTLRNKIKNLLIKGRHYSENIEFQKAIKRINFFLCLSKNEYDFLGSLNYDLPLFIQRPLKYIQKEYISFIDYNKKNTILIGNSKNYFNNHIDILEIINENKKTNYFEFILPFNYGTNNKLYINYIKKLIKKSPNIKLLTDFLPYDDYNKLINQSCAAVYNSYRQMAGGNILLGLMNGVKIYLNTNNTLYTMYKDNGMKIFTIDDFKTDLENNNLKLSYDDMIYNFNILKKMYDEYPIEKFQLELYKNI